MEINGREELDMFSRLFRDVSPWVYPVSGFALLIVLGACALFWIPTARGGHLSPVDALFTATSAVCVTGLVVVDTAKDLSFWGQVTVLALLQAGGLGIMSLSTFLLMALGRSIPFRSRMIMEGTYSFKKRSDLRRLMVNMLLFTFLFEAAGACLLFWRFRESFPTGEAVFQAVFHAASAFCNAGFSLFSDSLASFRGDWLINSTMAVLIVAGGLGFVVLHELVMHRKGAFHRRHYWNQLSLHTRLVLFMTAFLLVAGAAMFALCEMHQTLGPLSRGERVLASVFQSVTTRTAGFNTLDFASMNQITLMGTILLMFIGASPGSTGGGIKTSTVGIVLVLFRAGARGSDHVHAFKRAVSKDAIDRAFTVGTLGMVVVVAGLACLLLTESHDLPPGAGHGGFLKLLFEAVSAFATVGLSMGVTPELTAWGKLVLVALMFTGRLGPLVIAMAIRSSRGARGNFFYAEENVMIG